MGNLKGTFWLIIAILSFQAEGVSQIKHDDVKDALRVTYVRKNEGYTPQKATNSEFNSYCLKYSDSRNWFANPEADQWIIRNNCSWTLPSFWPREWGTKGMTIDQAKTKTLEWSYLMSESDPLLKEIVAQLDRDVVEVIPGAKALAKNETARYYYVKENCDSSNVYIYYDVNNDGFSDVNVSIKVSYRDSTMVGYSMPEENTDVACPTKTFRPKYFGANNEATRSSKKATYNINIRFFRKPNDFSLYAVKSDFRCVQGQTSLLVRLSLYDRYVNACKWTCGIGESKFNVYPVFSDLSSTYLVSLPEEFLDFQNPKLLFTCTLNTFTQTANHTYGDHIENGETGRMKFVRDSSYLECKDNATLLHCRGIVFNDLVATNKHVQCNHENVESKFKLGTTSPNSTGFELTCNLVSIDKDAIFYYYRDGIMIDSFIILKSELLSLKERAVSCRSTHNIQSTSVRWVNPFTQTFQSATNELKAIVRVNTNKKISAASVESVGIKRIRLISSTQSPTIAYPNPFDSTTFEFEQLVYLDSGNNFYKWVITFSDGTRSESETITVSYLPDTPIDPPKSLRDLYVISVGINNYKNISGLQFACKDAIQIDSSFKTQGAKGDNNSLWNSVHSICLLDSSATSSAIIDTIRHLNIDPNDMVVFFYSGHGTSYENNFYFCTYDFDERSPARTSVSIELLRKTLDDKNCSSLIIIDACESGTALHTKAASMNLSEAIFENDNILLNRDKFSITFASCNSFQTSADSQEEKNGLLTKAILLAFSNRTYIKTSTGEMVKPDFDGNGILTLYELELFCYEVIPDISAHTQDPGVNKSNSRRSLNLFVLPQQ